MSYFRFGSWFRASITGIRYQKIILFQQLFTTTILLLISKLCNSSVSARRMYWDFSCIGISLVLGFLLYWDFSWRIIPDSEVDLVHRLSDLIRLFCLSSYSLVYIRQSINSKCQCISHISESPRSKLTSSLCYSVPRIRIKLSSRAFSVSGPSADAVCSWCWYHRLFQMMARDSIFNSLH